MSTHVSDRRIFVCINGDSVFEVKGVDNVIVDGSTGTTYKVTNLVDVNDGHSIEGKELEDWFDTQDETGYANCGLYEMDYNQLVRMSNWFIGGNYDDDDFYMYMECV